MFLLISESSRKSPQAESATGENRSSQNSPHSEPATSDSAGAETFSQEDTANESAERNSVTLDSPPDKSSDGHAVEMTLSSGEYSHLESSEESQSGRADDLLDSAGDSAEQSAEGQEESMQVSAATSQDSEGESETETIPVNTSSDGAGGREQTVEGGTEPSPSDVDRTEGSKGTVSDPSPNDSDSTKGKLKDMDDPNTPSNETREEGSDVDVKVPEADVRREEEALNAQKVGREVELTSKELTQSQTQPCLGFQPVQAGTVQDIKSLPTISVEDSGESDAAENAVKGGDPLQPMLSPAQRRGSGELMEPQGKGELG